ncbi:LysR family transcriptional regulator [Streptomyces sp. NPDC004609]|uniref:LysR family transcriptional regulator n=1 Tax=Streptomyces sp. NPDC004609 TaxID=3364704 RepID=UPI0036AC0484
MLDRHEFEAFMTLAQELHFGRTAERLHVTTGRISQTIKQLERRIGAPLFERTSRPVRLTPLGRQFHDDLRPAYDQIKAGIERAVATGRSISGAVRVGYSAPWCGDLLVKAADLFRVRHPDATVHIREIQLSDPLGPMRGGEVDLQITELPIDEPDITRGPVIYYEPRALLVPAGHPLARQDSVGVEDLADTTVITIGGTIPDYWLDHHYPRLTPSGRPIPKGLTLTYWQEVLPQVAAGRGVSPTCARAAHHYQHPGIVYVPFRDAPTVDYGILWPTARDHPRIHAFGRIVREVAARRTPALRRRAN